MADDRTLAATIVTPSGVPLGGNVTVQLFRDGRYTASYHMHSSSILGNFDFKIRALVTAADMPALLLYREGHVSGVDSDDWTESGTHPVIAAYWEAIESSATMSVAKDYEWGGVVGTLEDIVEAVVDIVGGAVGAVAGVVIALGDGAMSWMGRLSLGTTIGIVAGVAVFAVALAFGVGIVVALVIGVIAGVAAGGATEVLVDQRGLEALEIAVLRQVYGDTLPYDKIRLTNMGAPKGAAFTMPGVDGYIYVNLGRAYSDVSLHGGPLPRPYEVLVHEAAHALQIVRNQFTPGWMCLALAEQTGMAIVGPGMLSPPHPLTPWSDLSFEEQARLVDSWYGGVGASERQLPMDQMSPYYPTIVQHVLDNGQAQLAPANLRTSQSTALVDVGDPAAARLRIPFHDRIRAFFVDAAGAVHENRATIGLDSPPRWEGDASLRPAGSAAAGPIAAVSRVPGRVEIFWVRPDGGIDWMVSDHRVNGGAWKPPVAIVPPGHAAPGAIACVSRNPGRLDLYWIGAKGDVRAAWWDETVDDGFWHSPVTIVPQGHALAGALAAAARTPDVVDLFWIGPDHGVGTARSERFDPGPHFSAPIGLAPPEAAAAGALCAVARTPKHLDVFWIRPNGSVLSAWWDAGVNNTQWNGPFEVATQTSAQPGALAALARTTGHLDVFWINRDGAVVSKWWDQSTNPDWFQQAFRLSPDNIARPALLAAVSVDPSRTDVLWSGTGAVVHLVSNWWHAGTNNAHFNVPVGV